MNVIERIETAVCQPDTHKAVRDLILALSAEGHRRQPIIDSFTAAIAHMEEHKTITEQQRDAVDDVLDGLYGWCHPNYWLLADEFPEEMRPSCPPSPPL